MKTVNVANWADVKVGLPRLSAGPSRYRESATVNSVGKINCEVYIDSLIDRPITTVETILAVTKRFPIAATLRVRAGIWATI